MSESEPESACGPLLFCHYSLSHDVFPSTRSTDRLIARRCVNLAADSEVGLRPRLASPVPSLHAQFVTAAARWRRQTLRCRFPATSRGTNGLHFGWQTTWPCLSQDFYCLLRQAQQLKSKYDQRWQAANSFLTGNWTFLPFLMWFVLLWKEEIVESWWFQCGALQLECWAENPHSGYCRRMFFQYSSYKWLKNGSKVVEDDSLITDLQLSSVFLSL